MTTDVTSGAETDLQRLPKLALQSTTLHGELPRERVDQQKLTREMSRRTLATPAGATTAAALIAAPCANVTAQGER